MRRQAANDAGPAAPRQYRLVGADGETYLSEQRGTLGGHRGTRVYGRFDCPAALAALARGQYTRQRVFFPDELTALAAGFRPCGRCLPKLYSDWKRDPEAFHAARRTELGG